MSIRSSNRFLSLRYEPGNPEFPTLPDGIKVPHVTIFGRSASHQFEAHPVRRGNLRAVTPNSDAATFFGHQTQTTWIKPSRIDFGTIPVPVQRVVSLYNARPIPVTVTALSLPAGVTVAVGTFPTTLQPYAGAEWTLEASPDGDATFDEQIEFTLTGQPNVFGNVEGQRLFVIEENVQRPIIETLRFNSDVIRSFDGTEAPSSLLQSPTSFVDYFMRFTDDLQRIRFRNRFMTGSSALVVGGQKWYEARPLTSQALASATTLDVDTSSASFVVDEPVSVVTPAGEPILATIAAIGPTSLTLASPLGTAAPAGSQVMPVGLGYVSAFPQFGTYPVAAEDAAYTVAFNRQLSVADPTDFLVFNGLTVLEAKNEIARTARGQFERVEDVLDSGKSNRIAFNTFPQGEEGQGYRITLEGRAAIWRYRQWLEHLGGSYREFYVPTWRNDIPGADLPLSSVTFDVPASGLADFGIEDPRRSVRFKYPDGTVLYRNILTVLEAGGIETITVDSAVPAGTPEISYLQRVRLVGDSAVFRHERGGLARLTFAYRTVIT